MLEDERITLESEGAQYVTPVAKFLSGVGHFFLDSYLGKISIILWKSAGALWQDIRTGRLQVQQIIQQTYFTGVEALPLVGLIALLLGSLTILQAMTVMPKVGFSDFFGSLMVIVINRELGPILTAFIIAGRTGSALAAYLSYMKVGQEIDALESMGIDPIRFLVMPAAVGAMLAVLTCTVFFNAIAIFMGFFSVKMFTLFFPDVFPIELQWSIYSNSLLGALSWPDLVMTLVKPLFFGAIISANAAYYGISIRRDIRQVPQAASKSVVSSFIIIVIGDIILSSIYIVEYMSNLSGVL
jgi:phospholipid/cholesterol/gamma-HCH transport system permease protein